MNNTEPLGSLGRYELIKVLGRGAMGVVYEALDPKLGRTVAIKTVLGSHLLDPRVADDYIARFKREAKAAGRLTHPHIVTVFDFGTHDEGAYLVMQYVRGRELAQAFDSGEVFPLDEAVRISCQLLDALGYAHEHGVVHRDVKPANVLLDERGEVKLTDFGVARLADTNLERTAPGTIVGTPSYMSPEQILGQPVGSRADLFAAGVILYRFLTGRKPFAGQGMFAVQHQIVHEDPPAPTTINPQLLPLWDAVIRRALAKRPQDRYEDAQAFIAALQEALAASTVPSPPAPLPHEAIDLVLTTGTGGPIPQPVLPVTPPVTPPGPPMPSAPVAPPPPTPRPSSPMPRTITAAPLPMPPISPPPSPRFSAVRRLRWGLLLAAAALMTAAGLLLRGPGVKPPPAAAVPEVPLKALPSVPLAAPVPASAPPLTSSAAPLPAPTIANPGPVPALALPRTTPTTKPPETAAPVPRSDARCAELRQRWQLGDTLSADDQTYFDSRCRR